MDASDPLRVLLVDDDPERIAVLRSGLASSGYELIATISSPLVLLRAVDEYRPDVIIIDMDSPTRDVLEHVVVVSQNEPRPIVMFASDGARDAIRDAVRAGVSAYVVDGLDPARVRGILDVAVARFEEHERLRDQIELANLKLAERKNIDRAKGILMHKRGCSEDHAYHALRHMAMQRGERIGETAQRIIDAGELLG